MLIQIVALAAATNHQCERFTDGGLGLMFFNLPNAGAIFFAGLRWLMSENKRLDKV